MKTNGSNTTEQEKREQEQTNTPAHTTKEYKDIVPTLSTEERAFLGGFLYAKITDLRLRA